jgi:hypothetical protein
MHWKVLVLINLALFTYIGLQATLILYFTLQNQPYSFSFRRDGYYYDRVNATDIAEHAKATAWLENAVKNSSKATSFRNTENRSSSVCLDLPTVPRTENTYVTKTVQSIYEFISEEERKKHFSILSIVHFQDQYHHEAVKLSPLFNLVTERTHSLRVDGLSPQDWLKNEKLDYAALLSLCLEHGTEYALVLEDDVQATKHVAAKLSSVLASVPSAEWCAIKLFYSEYFAGWGVEELPLLISVSAAAGISAAVLLSLILRRPLRSAGLLPSQLRAAAAAWAVFLSAMAAWALVFVGRQNLVTRGDVPLLRAVGFATLGPGFNPWTPSQTQAVVFARACLPGLIRWLRDDEKSQEVDLSMDRYLAGLAAPSYTHLPSLFQHVGHFSSLRYKNGESYAHQLADFKTALTWRWD